MERRLVGWLLGCLTVISAVPLSAQDTIVVGTLTNLGYDGRSGGRTASLLFAATRLDDSTTVTDLVIGAPLGGSGQWNGYAWSDTLLLRSIAPGGDSIAWLGWRMGGDRMEGVYEIYGGQWRRQGGRWEGRLGILGQRYLAEHAAQRRPTRLAGADLADGFARFLPGRAEPSPATVHAPKEDILKAATSGARPRDPPAAASASTTAGPANSAVPGFGWLGLVFGVPLVLFVGWVASFGRDLRLIHEDRRVLLALIFVPGLYLVLATSVALMLGVAAGVLWLLWLLAEAIHRVPVGIMFAIVVGACVGLVSVLMAVWKSGRRAEFPVHAEQLQRADAPALYSMLDRLAHRLGATLPDSVVLEMGTSFFVTEAKVRSFTGLCGRRTLCVSAPFLHVLTAAEVEAILAHELAHFSGADTAYSRRFYPVYRGASEALQGMATVSDNGGDSGAAAAIPLLLPQLLVGWYLACFARLERRNSRDREFRADRLAGEVTAPAVMASALLKVHAYAPFWSAIPDGIRELHGQGKAFINAAVAFETARATPALLEAVRTGEAHQLTHPTDSHPSLADRLAALGFPDRTTAPLGEGPPATDLVADLPGREERLTDTVSYLVLRHSGLLK